MATPDNPFLALKARLVVLVFFAIGLGLGLLLVVLSAFKVVPLQAEDPILAPILYTLIFSSLCLAILIVARHSPIQLPLLIGTWPQHLSWVRLLGLVIGVFLFSLGAFQLFYLGLSLVAPQWLETTWQQSVLLSAEKTASPRLYNGVMVFSVVVVAPVTEEFIFRGILLHRWGVKWGIRPAILMTSILFGLLHSNLVGLFVFGVVMALLYLSTRSLLVPMVAHAMNNAIASGVEWLTTQISPEPLLPAQRELQTS
ncbi:MAG TPA: CPBP family intramembrane metalloprotease, partial [Leptolyngbyaceae cyanobacterium M65_K2018_010]|nr:CPBP family intramembrane metalloprotease [Leptolyngbyaceae cyanobacterium M65_K2018_010]